MLNILFDQKHILPIAHTIVIYIFLVYYFCV